MQKLLPDIRQLSNFYVFQQDSAPVHRARESIELLAMETLEFIPPTLRPPTKQSGFKSGRLYSVVRNAGEGLQEADQGH